MKMMEFKFNRNDKVRVIKGDYKGMELRVTGRYADNSFNPAPPMYNVEVTNDGGFPAFIVGELSEFGEEFLELIEPDVREVRKKIEPELVKVGDRIRAVRVADDSGIEYSKSGIVHEKKNYYGAISFWTRGKHELNRIGYADDQNSHYILEEESTIHELTLKPVGTKFKADRGQGSYYYLIYTKVREGYWLCESYFKSNGEFKEVTLRSEVNTINEWNKGRSTYLDVL